MIGISSSEFANWDPSCSQISSYLGLKAILGEKEGQLDVLLEKIVSKIACDRKKGNQDII